MKKFFLKLIPFFAIGLLIAGVNYFVDPANLYNPEYETGIANYLTQGYNVTNVVNYNERQLQKAMAAKLKVLPSVMILGSSRILGVHKEDVEAPSFINCGVSGATFEDMLAIYWLYEKRGAPLKRVIIDVDPWMFNDNHGQIRWKDLKNEYESFLAALNGDSNYTPRPASTDWYSKYAQLASFSYFKTSVDYLKKGISKKYLPTHERVNDQFTRLVDGSISYDKNYRSADAAEVKKRVDDLLASSPLYSMGRFESVSANYREVFEKFVHYLQEKGIAVELYLSPFHPEVYEFMKTKPDYKNVFMVEGYLREFAAREHLKLYGSYDPKALGMDARYFYDGMHCDEEGIKIILAH